MFAYFGRMEYGGPVYHKNRFPRWLDLRSQALSSFRPCQHVRL